MKMNSYILYIALAALALGGCTQRNKGDAETTYTLYRDSPYLQKTDGANLDPKWNRVHIATFDAHDMDDDYNRSHCDRVREFYENDWRSIHEEKPEYWSHFWCEKGRYK